ncbi:hypothetical protein [Kitasatospora sp. KL5]|uniref:hypothetical protein n=1 Tax=Kitasatospora sp. KL5 TaxID=3425125 RepID=UPI003D6FB0A8
MADNETAAPATDTTPAAVEFSDATVDPQSLQDIIEDLSADEPAADPAPAGDQPKSDEVFEPLGNVINRP